MLNVPKSIEHEQGCLALEGRLETAAAPELEQAPREMLPGFVDILKIL